MKKIIYFICSIAFLGAFSSNHPKNIENVSISIIINKENPVETLTAGEAKLYWLRKIKKRWPELNKKGIQALEWIKI